MARKNPGNKVDETPIYTNLCVILLAIFIWSVSVSIPRAIKRNYIPAARIALPI